MKSVIVEVIFSVETHSLNRLPWSRVFPVEILSGSFPVGVFISASQEVLAESSFAHEEMNNRMKNIKY